MKKINFTKEHLDRLQVLSFKMLKNNSVIRKGNGVGTSASIERYQGIENFMYIPPNPAQVEQLLTNFKDIDVMDIYTPLQSLYRSNRYDLVKENTL